MFSNSSSYALRSVVLLASTGTRMGGHRIAARLKVPANYLGKILQQLCSEGILVSRKGWGGGFRLSKRPQEIKVCDVIRPFEGSAAPRDCILGNELCTGSSPCPLHFYWSQIKGIYELMTRQVTIRDLVQATRTVSASSYGNSIDIDMSNYVDSHTAQLEDGEMTLIDTLVREHGLIRQFLDNLDMARECIEKGENPDRRFFETALEFIDDFVNRFHHFKEEYLMFGRLAMKHEGRIDGQIEALRYQHDQNRNHVMEIRNNLDGYARGDEYHTTKLLESLAAYISNLRRHMIREDHVFYPMALTELSGGETTQLEEEFRKEDAKRGGETFEKSQALVQRLGGLL